jgi:hypothetical protein
VHCDTGHDSERKEALAAAAETSDSREDAVEAIEVDGDGEDPDELDDRYIV